MVQRLEDVHGILVPGGFGERGTEGKIEAVRFARQRKRAVLRHLLRHADGGHRGGAEPRRHARHASSTEFGPCETPVVGLLTEWAQGNELVRREAGGDLGGTMRLGAYPASLTEGSLAREVYGGAPSIEERHRHRYEVNIHYREALEKTGLRFSGLSPDGILPEIIEYPDHPWFIGVQYPPGAEVEAVRAAPVVQRLHRRLRASKRGLCNGDRPHRAGLGR